MGHGRHTIALLILLLGIVHLAVAQPADTVVTQAGVMMLFDEARALAVDPSGKLYVVDAGKEAVLQLDSNGELLASLGGPGAEAGQFNEVADIDPTTGLIWVVADAGNSRLQRFSHTFLHLETLPVARISRFTPGATGRTVPIGDEGGVEEADGRPIAVATSNANEIFAIDETQGLVVKWDASRRLERAIGGYDAGEGALVEPVALATDAASLFVADRGQAAVLIYDLFGGYIRTLAPGRATDVRALTVVRDELWIVLPERLLVYHTRGRLLRVLDVKLGEPLVDVAHYGGMTYLLTPTRLLRAKL
ncbi:MAG: NHL repeat-containing protein [Rhodothermales bacterium]